MLSLFSDPEILIFLKKNKVVIADIGARGKLIHPWTDIDKNVIQVIGFEPDEREIERLKKTSPNNVYLPFALWNHEQNLTLHMSVNPYTSSIHFPNFDLLKRYDDKYSNPRRTKKLLRMKSQTLDAIVRQYNIHPDFLKIDTQGSEYEILEGAVNTIEEDTFAVLVETWTEEVHKKQKLTGDILQLMHKNGFTLMDINIAASWYRKTARKYNIYGKSQIIGLDLLFFRKDMKKEFFSYEKLVKSILIADIYGYPDVAIELAEYGQNNLGFEKRLFEILRKEIIRKWNMHSSFLGNFQMKTKQILNSFVRLTNLFLDKNKAYPPLHE